MVSFKKNLPKSISAMIGQRSLLPTGAWVERCLLPLAVYSSFSSLFCYMFFLFFWFAFGFIVYILVASVVSVRLMVGVGGGDGGDPMPKGSSTFMNVVRLQKKRRK